MGYGHSSGVLFHYYGREAGLELREDIGAALEAGMVITNNGNEDITGFPYGPDNNVIG